MMRISKYLLMLGFALALGCGESTNGQTGEGIESTPAPTESASPSTAGQSPVTPPAGEPGVAPTEAAETGETAADVASATYVEGTHYERLPRPVPTSAPDKIEVAEVFWYGCSHCYDFESVFQEWKSGVADDVVVIKSPAMWDRQGVMANHARIYYTAQALGVLDQITPATFRTLIVDREPLNTEDEIATLFTDIGVSREEFDRTFKSFGVTSAVRQAEARQKAYGVKGTPEVIVDGTYRIPTSMAGSHEAVLKVADFLIEKIRRESAAAPADSAGS